MAASNFCNDRKSALRLTSTKQKWNCKDKHEENLRCPPCETEEDTKKKQQHVLRFNRMAPHDHAVNDLYNSDDVSLWVSIVELFQTNERRGSAKSSGCAQEHMGCENNSGK